MRRMILLTVAALALLTNAAQAQIQQAPNPDDPRTRAWEARQAKKRAIEEAQAENARQIKERAEAYKRDAEAASSVQRAKDKADYDAQVAREQAMWAAKRKEAEELKRQREEREAAVDALRNKPNPAEIGDEIRFTWGQYPAYPIGCTVFDDAFKLSRMQEDDPVGAWDIAKKIDGHDDDRHLCVGFGIGTWPPHLDHLNQIKGFTWWRIEKKDMSRSTATHEWFCIASVVSYDTRPADRRLPCWWLYLPIKDASGPRYIVKSEPITLPPNAEKL
jgi:hypothetical protein